MVWIDLYRLQFVSGEIVIPHIPCTIRIEGYNENSVHFFSPVTIFFWEICGEICRNTDTMTYGKALEHPRICRENLLRRNIFLKSSLSTHRAQALNVHIHSLYFKMLHFPSNRIKDTNYRNPGT